MKFTLTPPKKEDPLSKVNSPDELRKLARRLKWHRKALATILAILIVGIAWIVAYKAAEGFWLKTIIISAVQPGIRTAQAAELQVLPDIGDCEQYRPIVEKYFGKLTDEALFVAKNESGCIADRVSPKNSDGSKDYCLFQITREPLAAQSLDVCVRRAFEKYTNGRVGEKNWSDFYAVCPRNVVNGVDLAPTPKYPNVIKNCS